MQQVRNPNAIPIKKISNAISRYMITPFIKINDFIAYHMRYHRFHTHHEVLRSLFADLLAFSLMVLRLVTAKMTNGIVTIAMMIDRIRLIDFIVTPDFQDMR